MYKILLADEEGVSLKALRVMITQSFGGDCDIRLATSFQYLMNIYRKYQPDLLFLNVDMAGVNGIITLRELHSKCADCTFMILSGSDKTDFGRDGKNNNVFGYLTKPYRRVHTVELLDKTFQYLEALRRRNSVIQQNKDKFDLVVPIIESGFISLLLQPERDQSQWEQYLALLSINEPCGWVMKMHYSQVTEHGTMCNPIGSTVLLSREFQSFRKIVKAFFPTAIIGPILANTVHLLIPCEKTNFTEEQEAQRIKRAGNLSTQLFRKLNLNFRYQLSEPARLEHLYKKIK